MTGAAAAAAGGFSRERTGAFEGVGGTPLAYRAWLAAEPWAVLLVSHGIGEHGGRYARLGRELAAEGVSVYAPDHRGHGRSGGRRGHVSRFRELVDDFERFRAEIHGGSPTPLPHLLLAQSFGALIAIRYLQAHPGTPLRGAVLVSPYLGLAMRPPRWKLALAGLLSRVAPTLSFASGVDAGHLSTDPATEAAYRADPLVHDRITPRMHVETGLAIGRAFAEADRVRHPLLVLLAGDDRIVDAAAARRWTEGLRAPVEVRRYAEMMHEPLNERERSRVTADVLAWLRRMAA